MKSLYDIRDYGRTEGRAEGLMEAAKNLIRAGKLALEDIAEACNMPLQQVQNLAKSLKA